MYSIDQSIHKAVIKSKKKNLNTKKPRKTEVVKQNPNPH